jgi:hypothetical protein
MVRIGRVAIRTLRPLARAGHNRLGGSAAVVDTTATKAVTFGERNCFARFYQAGHYSACRLTCSYPNHVVSFHNRPFWTSVPSKSKIIVVIIK